MMNFLPGQLLPYETRIDPIYLVALALVVALVVILRMYSAYQESKTSATKKKKSLENNRENGTEGTLQTGHTDRKELKFVFARYNFTREQAEFFTNLCVANEISSPAQLISSPRALDDLFKRAMHKLETATVQNRDTEKKKTLIFTIREAIENYHREEHNITSTRSIQNSQQVTLITSAEEHFPAVIIDNSTDGLLCSIPRDFFGNELRIRVWSPIQVLFYTRSGQSYRLKTRLLRYVSSRTETRMVLAHTNSVHALPNRHHERKALKTACTFSYVTVGNVSRNGATVHEFFPDKKTTVGTIMDISAGGCSIITHQPLAAGDYVQITTVFRDQMRESIIGKVVRINLTGEASDPVMHIQFAKIARTTMNHIFSFIYSYGERTK